MADRRAGAGEESARGAGGRKIHSGWATRASRRGATAGRQPANRSVSRRRRLPSSPLADSGNSPRRTPFEDLRNPRTGGVAARARGPGGPGAGVRHPEDRTRPQPDRNRTDHGPARGAARERIPLVAPARPAARHSGHFGGHSDHPPPGPRVKEPTGPAAADRDPPGVCGPDSPGQCGDAGFTQRRPGNLPNRGRRIRAPRRTRAPARRDGRPS